MIRYLVMDVDGTLTDSKIYMGNDGEIMKAFNVKDGCGIRDIAIPHGLIPVIITSRSSQILEKRCNELGIINFYQGITNKMERLQMITNDFSMVAYIGDDINDLPCMEAVKVAGGIIACPFDAAPKVVAIADFISSQNGGNGAVREFIEWLINRC